MSKLTRVQPGFYHDDAGTVHIDIPELLALNGYPNTQNNRELATRAAVYELQRRYPDKPIAVIDREDES